MKNVYLLSTNLPIYFFIHYKEVKGYKHYKRWLFMKYGPFKTLSLWPCKQVNGGTLGRDVFNIPVKLPQWLPEFVFDFYSYYRSRKTMLKLLYKNKLLNNITVPNKK